MVEIIPYRNARHDEAITYTRQTLSYPAPAIAALGTIHFARQDAPIPQTNNDLTANANIPGGKFILGSDRKQGFTFDNERLAHALVVIRRAFLRPDIPVAKRRVRGGTGVLKP